MMIRMFEFVLLITVAVIGFYALSRLWRSQTQHKQLEKQILQAARRHKGRVSLAILLAETDGNLDQLQSILDRWCKAGICSLELSEHGKPLYVFDDLVSEPKILGEPK